MDIPRLGFSWNAWSGNLVPDTEDDKIPGTCHIATVAATTTTTTTSTTLH